VARLPFRRAVLTYNARLEFPSIIDDRWRFYVMENGLTPIRALAHRCDMLASLDLRPILPKLDAEILLIQGREDRIIGRREFELLKSALPRATDVVLPTVGHQVHLTHGELLASLIGEWFLPCSP
jgi:pimeloyl-ACP methyl ester carboxylesterase